MSRRRTLLLLSFFLVVSSAACTRGLLSYFPHRLHLATLECGGAGQPACLSCASCHQGDAADHGTWAPPTAQRCAGCHENADHAFRDAVRPSLATLPAGKRIHFAHAEHLAKPELKGQCVKCHSGVVGVEGGAPLFPPMATCLSCHEHQEQFDTNVCTNCHEARDLRQLQPLTHDVAWDKRHGPAARANPDQCALCHAQTSCDTCHDSSNPLGPAVRNPEALERNFVHRFDFLSRHALEARSQPGQCATCHVQTECDACHISRGVSGAGGTSLHPLGWASGLGAATNSHGPAARRDIGGCASCHDQGSATNCVRCHRVGATGGSPHPIGWRSSQPMSEPACAACHGGTP